MILALLIALAGGIGSSLRYLVDQAITHLLGRRQAAAEPLPWAILAINTTGSFALGVITAAATRGAIGHDLQLVLGVGICGGYTTFSTTMVDTLRLGLRHRPIWAALNLVGTLALTTGAAALGWALGS